MSIAEAIAMTAVVLTVTLIVVGAVTTEKRGRERKQWAAATTAVGITAAVLYIIAIWTHALGG